MGRSSNFLGVAVSDRSVTCAEVSIGSGDRRTVRRTATFVFPAETTLDSPDALGQALAAFLRQRKFTASRVVVGVPARWLIAIEKEVPPADEQQARSMLRLQAERLAVAEHGDVVFDFAGRTSSSVMSKVLLVGMVRDKLHRVEQMMDAAGMSVVAITSTGLTLAARAARAKGMDTTGGGGVLMLGRSGGEVIWRHDGSPRMLRHVSYLMNGHGHPPIAPLGAELHRAVAFAAANGEAGSELLVVDGVGLPAEQVTQLGERIGVNVRADDGVKSLRVNVDPGATSEKEGDEPATVGRFAPAMSLALAAARPELLPLDFRHSRLTPAPPQRLSRTQWWGIAIGMTVAIALVALFFTVRSKEHTLADLEGQLKTMKNNVTDAQSNVERVKYGRGYFENRPPILDLMRELSTTFGESERIWVTSIGYREGNRFTISGKASDPKTPVNFSDRLRANPRFSDVRMPSGIVEADPKTREVSFTVSFQFNPEYRDMVLTKRERYVGIITVAVLSILVLDQFVIGPAMTKMEELDAKIALAQQQHLSAQQLFNSSRRANRDWKTIAGDAMLREGDPESRVLNSVREWAQEEGMRLPSVIPQPAQIEKGFNKIVFRATGNGNLSQVGRFLYRVQTAQIPLRITDLQISSKDGTDELSVNFGIATISPAPEANRPAGGGGGGGAAPAQGAPGGAAGTGREL